MTDTVIRVENLSKRYTIGRQREQNYSTLRDVIAGSARSFGRRILQPFRSSNSMAPNTEEFWALQDICFEVQRGERLGIIGRNGAGKSTLLKILSRITEPTAGRVTLKGRVASLLEVGTGFHPELTGRENVFLNGAILGMSRQEIKNKFDEIVDFSGVEKFIDTPVKRYSSGMYVRLAFAVAAHLEPEILLVDEVLAVGDAAFQKKCLGKLDDVARGGRTVLFVSHNMATIQTLCRRGMLLNNGSVALIGDVEQTIVGYFEDIEAKSLLDLADRTDRSGKGKTKLVGIDVSANRIDSTTLVTGASARFVFHVDRICPRMSCYFTIYNLQGHQVANFSSAIHSAEDLHDVELGPKFVCDIDELTLVPGRYRINVALFSSGEMQDHVEAAAVFDVEQGVIRGRPINRPIGYGNVYIPHRWFLPT